MKKNTRITESDIRRIVRKIIQEQITPKFDYLFSREDGETSATQGQKLFFVQNGDTFDVWVEEYTRDGSKGRMIKTGKKLPKISELGIIYDESNERFGNSDGSIIASDIAKIITPQMERSRGNWIIYVDNEGIPTKGKLSIRSLPKDFFGKKGGKGFKLKNGAVIFGNDYFISENDRGIGISIQEPIKAGKA